MERNAAELLHERLTAWAETPANTSVLKHRGPDWWPAHVEAVRWLDEVETFAATTPQADGLSEVLNRLRHGILATNTRMDDSPAAARPSFEKTDLLAVALLGSNMRTRPGVVSVESVQGLLEVVRDAQDLLIADTSLSEEERGYVVELLKSLNNALVSVGVTGAADVRRLSNELVGALASLFCVGDGEQREEAGDLVQRVLRYVKGLVVGEVAPKAIGVAAGEVVKHLTTGG